MKNVKAWFSNPFLDERQFAKEIFLILTNLHLTWRSTSRYNIPDEFVSPGHFFPAKEMQENDKTIGIGIFFKHFLDLYSLLSLYSNLFLRSVKR